ncbi:MAG TPA: peptidylprolyl isomerase [Asticcacaulis sp.]|nr:peptidylprolyl isomerase [Asticcacaulis sp.]
MIGKSAGLAVLALILMAASASHKPGPSPQEIVDAAPASAWQDVPADDLVIMTLGDGQTVTYQLAPALAPVHVANIRQLVRSGYFDGASVLRVQDNYVVQWGRPDEDPTKPTGINANPPAEYETALKGVKFKALPYRDTFAVQAGYINGWPAANDGKAAWLVHCYGMIGVARDVPPSTGDATQLYTVIGQAPRQLDRNLAVVGRILNGMDALTALKRGTEALGFYKTDAERLKIVSAKLASDLPAATRPAFQTMDAASPTFDTWVHARANRDQTFFVRPAGTVDICNAQVPVRRKP